MPFFSKNKKTPSMSEGQIPRHGLVVFLGPLGPSLKKKAPRSKERNQCPGSAPPARDVTSGGWKERRWGAELGEAQRCHPNRELRSLGRTL